MIRQINVKFNQEAPDIWSPDIRPAAKRPSAMQNVEILHDEIESRFGIETACLKPGFKMVIVNHDNPQGFRMGYDIDQAPVIFSFNLSLGHRCTMTRGEKKGTILERKAGESVLTYLPGSAGIVEIPQGNPVKGVSIHFSMQMFRELFQEETSPPFSMLIHQDRSIYLRSGINRDTALALKQIMACPYKGRLKQVFLEAKALELAVNALAVTNQTGGQIQPNFSPGDLERVKEAYEILFHRMEDPPGLDELARQVALNRNKLNRGFRRIYGGTVFKVLRDLRLGRASCLLLHTDLSLADIAFSVGYNNQSNFTTAFHRQWGETPNSVRRNHHTFRSSNAFLYPSPPYSR